MSIELVRMNGGEIEERKRVSLSDVETALREVLEEKTYRLRQITALEDEIEKQNQRITALRAEQTRIIAFFEDNNYPNPEWLDLYPDPSWVVV